MKNRAESDKKQNNTIPLKSKYMQEHVFLVALTKEVKAVVGLCGSAWSSVPRVTVVNQEDINFC